MLVWEIPNGEIPNSGWCPSLIHHHALPTSETTLLNKTDEGVFKGTSETLAPGSEND
jgi:hypothetical protein